jgi:hypothetical protein
VTPTPARFAAGARRAKLRTPTCPRHAGPFFSNEWNPLMRSAIEILNAIEARAERAIVQELRHMKKEVLHLRSSLSPEDPDHADALLLKLGRMESDQAILTADAGASEQEFQAVAQAA